MWLPPGEEDLELIEDRCGIPRQGAVLKLLEIGAAITIKIRGFRLGKTSEKRISHASGIPSLSSSSVEGLEPSMLSVEVMGEDVVLVSNR